MACTHSSERRSKTCNRVVVVEEAVVEDEKEEGTTKASVIVNVENESKKRNDRKTSTFRLVNDRIILLFEAIRTKRRECRDDRSFTIFINTFARTFLSLCNEKKRSGERENEG